MRRRWPFGAGVLALAGAGLMLAAPVAGPLADAPFARAALAQGDAVARRQGQMKAMARALGPLLDMAQGRLPYDAARAGAGAAELAALAAGDPMALYPPGSDRESLGRGLALAAIWQDGAGFRAASASFAEAAQQLQQQAGAGPQALRGAVAAVGAACSGCHSRYRAPN